MAALVTRIINPVFCCPGREHVPKPLVMFSEIVRGARHFVDDGVVSS